MRLFKSYFLILTALTVFCSTACNTTKFTGETLKNESVASGQISVISGGYGKTKNVAVHNAIQNAFKNILIHGIPGSNQETPLLGKNARIVYDENRTYLENFLETKTQEFILNQKVNGFKFANLDSPSTEVELLINLNSLRTYLEQNGMIRAFGL